MPAHTTRREFVKNVTATAAAIAGAGAGMRPRAATAAEAKRVYGANERIRIAVLGPGDRASSLMSEVAEFREQANCEIVAVCDLWPRRCEIAAGKLKRRAGWEVATYRNTDELYAAKNIDAVVIGTPDFAHARHCAEAVEQGKDVYVEKPLADVIEDAKLVRKVVKASDRIVQIGTGMRSEGVYRGAAEYVRSGAFGKVLAVEMFWNVNQSKRWRREEDVALLAKDISEGRFDVGDAWKRYRLNRPEEPFDPRKYLEFRLFWPYSCGLPDQWMSHQIDTVAMITGDPYPKSCVASGGIYGWKDGRRNPDIFTAVFEYPSGFQVTWHSRQFNGHADSAEFYHSNWGSMNLRTGKITGEGAPDEHKSPGSRKLEEKDIPKLPDVPHMLNWLECLRTRKAPNADIEAGYTHSVAVSMAIVAYHTGKRVTFDVASQEMVVA